MLQKYQFILSVIVKQKVKRQKRTNYYLIIEPGKFQKLHNQCKGLSNILCVGDSSAIYGTNFVKMLK